MKTRTHIQIPALTHCTCASEAPAVGGQSLGTRGGTEPMVVKPRDVVWGVLRGLSTAFPQLWAGGWELELLWLANWSRVESKARTPGRAGTGVICSSGCF